MELIKQLLEVYVHDDIGPNSKSWADGYDLIGTKIDILKNPDKIKFAAYGKLKGGSWALVKVCRNTYDNEFTRNLSRAIQHGDYAAFATDASSKIQVIATFATYSTIKTAKSLKVSHLVAKTGSRVPAHLMYAELVKTGYTLLTSSQSRGGQRVWEKLSAVKGVTVYGWNEKTKTPINLGNKFDNDSETHSTDDDADVYADWWELDSAKDKKIGKAEHKYVLDRSSDVLLVATKTP